jgi:hypothetical protein
MTSNLILELIMGVLLLATCGYCCILSRKLKALRAEQTELLRTIEVFDGATRRAENNLASMKNAGVAMNRELGETTQRAVALIDELSVMVDAGDHIASRIEGAMREVRAVGAQAKKAA